MSNTKVNESVLYECFSFQEYKAEEKKNVVVKGIIKKLFIKQIVLSNGSKFKSCVLVLDNDKVINGILQVNKNKEVAKISEELNEFDEEKQKEILDKVNKVIEEERKSKEGQNGE